MRTEPPVSDPTENAQRPAAMATADPLLDPPGVRCVVASHGFQGIRCLRLIPPRANSVVRVLPRMMHPARFNAVTKVPSGGTRSEISRSDPAVVGIPLTVYRSLIAPGMPIDGP